MSYTVKQITLGGILCAMALVLSLVDRLIPIAAIIPLPGIKLGLANIVTLVALYFFGAPVAFTILIVRCILGSFFSGSISSLVFSLFGGIMAMLAMVLLRRSKQFSLFGVSIAGAAAHNAGQIIAGSVLLGSTAIIAYLPVLLVVSVFTGSAIAVASIPLFKTLRIIDLSLLS
ncbi:MAG: Gx transporter family protein [Clostridiales bacterium]|nr:Gx transporter family protein [Clostridiales bacterium]